MARRLQRTNRGSPQLPAPAEPPKVRRAAVTYGADKTIKSAAASSPARPNKRRIIYSSSDDDCDDLLAEPEELLRTVVKSPAIVIRPSAAKRKRPAKGKSAVTKRQSIDPISVSHRALSDWESEDDGADKCLKIPGEAVLAWHEMERKYYPAQILEYRGPNYQVEFLTSKKKCLPRDFFYTQYQEEFRTAPLGRNLQRLYEEAKTRYRKQGFRHNVEQETTKVLPAVNALLTSPIKDNRRALAFFSGKVSQLERELIYGPFDQHDVDIIVSKLKRDCFYSVFTTTASSRSTRLKSIPTVCLESPSHDPACKSHHYTGGSNNSISSSNSSRLPSPPPSQSQEKDRGHERSSRESSSSRSSSPSSSRSASRSNLHPISLLTKAPRADLFIRTVLFPEVAIRILMARSRSSYQEAEREMKEASKTKAPIHWAEEIMTALQCSLTGAEAANERRGIGA